MWIKIKNGHKEQLINLDRYCKIYSTEERLIGVTSHNFEVILAQGSHAEIVMLEKQISDTLYIEELGQYNCVECNRFTADYTFTENDNGMMERLPLCAECHGIISAKANHSRSGLIKRVKGN